MDAIEKMITVRVAEALIKSGRTITVDYNDGEPLALVNSTNVEAILAVCDETCEGVWFLVDQAHPGGGYDNFVRFIWGNERDCINDYSVALGDIIDPIARLDWDAEVTRIVAGLGVLDRLVERVDSLRHRQEWPQIMRDTLAQADAVLGRPSKG